jgi:hypothetical protein
MTAPFPLAGREGKKAAFVPPRGLPQQLLVIKHNDVAGVGALLAIAFAQATQKQEPK